jgi:hypothetical protein
MHRVCPALVLMHQLPLSANFHVNSVIFCVRLQELRSKLQPGKDPAKPVIFLVRMVVECLSKGEPAAASSTSAHNATNSTVWLD